MNWTSATVGEQAHLVAGALDLPIEAVMPPGAKGRAVVAYHERRFTTDYAALLTMQNRQEALEFGPFESACAAEVRAAVDAELKTLTYREREVLKLLYGLDGEAPLTLREVGQVFKVTRERVRQVALRAMGKLAHGGSGRRLLEAWTGNQEAQ
jgi:RNA polymerase sigma factor (sigma-70 family)